VVVGVREDLVGGVALSDRGRDVDAVAFEGARGLAGRALALVAELFADLGDPVLREREERPIVTT
jgi:hypothetical protein